MIKFKIIIFTVTIFLFGCKTTNQTKLDELTSLKIEIINLNKQIDVMKDELQFKESEISYWGHKHDSMLIKNK
jgi:uncharacterized membrane protein YgaE (UPF0421/DUF939 family)